MTSLSMVAALSGTAVGLIMGLTGAGGGVLAIPALTLLMGLSLRDAVPVALLAVAAAAAFGALGGLRRGQLRYRAALLMAGVGMLISPLGLWLGRHLPPALLTTTFSVLMLLIALRMLLGADGDPSAARPRRNCMLNPYTGRLRWNSRCVLTLSGVGALAGLFNGMLGIGGGFLIVPAFRQFSDVDMQAAAATSLGVIALISLATVLATLAQGQQIDASGLWFIAASLFGMWLGRRCAPLLPPRSLNGGFALLVLGVAVLWLVRTLG